MALGAGLSGACGTGDSGETPNGDAGTNGAGATGSTAAASGGGGTTTGARNGSSGGTSGSDGTSGGSGTTGAGGSTGTDDSGTRRPFPDTTARISILTDQLPNLTDAQRRFVVSHFVGTEKQTLAQSRPLRALSPDFLVLHYHLSMWQSAPDVTFIVDGKTWGNDYPTVTTHESWFWHDDSDQRIASTVDRKLLMNIGNPDFQAYWASSLADQVAAGDYDGIFFDSASPALLQAEVGGQDSRLAATGARDSKIAELGNETFIEAWESWMSNLDQTLAARGIPLIPNTSAFVTTWDNTDYGLTAGAFVEGFADPSWSLADWKASTNELLKLGAAHKIVILQNYLGGSDDAAKRLYYLGNYLLVKADKTYLEYFADGPLEWYPEWAIDLGAPSTTGSTVDDLANSGVYRRDFEKGTVLVNPTAAPVAVTLGSTFRRVQPEGGGAIDENGTEPGALSTSNVDNVSVAAGSAEILLR